MTKYSKKLLAVWVIMSALTLLVGCGGSSSSKGGGTGLVDGVSLSTYCHERLTEVAVGMGLSPDGVVANCDRFIADGSIKNADDVETYRDNALRAVR